MVIANEQGYREGYTGVFAERVHDILLTQISGGHVAVLDPLYRPGHYDLSGRAGKVEMDGVLAWTTLDVIQEGCRGRPYFLFCKQT